MTNSYRTLSRRDFITLSSASSLALLTGCATNPVTGRKMVDFIGESGEIAKDREAAPHQFSADFGALQDAELNAYITEVGRSVAGVSHRPNMPYSYRGVNAVYVNAYTFPGGSMAITRGMLLRMESEAELAAVLGHEIGHVNARHTAQAMTRGVVTQVAAVGAAIALGKSDRDHALLALGLGGLGAGALLARYSRDDEREADSLGLDYLVKAGYTPQGMIDLMDLLKQLGHSNASAVQLLFSTHPMSEERFKTSVSKAENTYASAKTQRLDRERYMDRTTALRARREAIETMQKGDEALAKGHANEGRTLLGQALKLAPDDYAGLLLMARHELATKQFGEAQRYARQAQDVYPSEPQACYVNGMASISLRQYDKAYESFHRYETLLPGNPNTIFFQGRSLEGMGRRDQAADCYARYLKSGGEGDYARYARQRLREWGYVKA
jgi:predicted Zn-dependent protease